MLRYLLALPLFGALLVLMPSEAEAKAHPPGIRPIPIVGTYENISSGGRAYIYQQGRGFLFINEHGSEAKFVYTAPGRLEMVWGEWAPTIATVGTDRLGRTLIRFDSGSKPGYWLRVW